MSHDNITLQASKALAAVNALRRRVIDILAEAGRPFPVYSKLSGVTGNAREDVRAISNALAQITSSLEGGALQASSDGMVSLRAIDASPRGGSYVHLDSSRQS